MSKKVLNVVKKGKDIKKSDEIFNLNEEIIIGINSKKEDSKNVKSNKKSVKSNPKKVTNKKKSQNDNKKSGDKRNVKEKRKLHKGLKIFIIVFLILIAIVLFLLSPVFNISKITVENNDNVSDEEIICLSGIQLGENTFKYINIDLMEKIKVNPYIENISVTRKYPTEIIINVTERKLEYFFRVNEKFASIDNQGYVVEISTEEYDIPEIIGLKTKVDNVVPGNRLCEKDLVELGKIIELYNYAINNEMGNQITNFIIEEDRIAIGLKGDKVAYIEEFINLNIKMLSLKVVLERTEGKAGEIFLDGQGESTSPLFREKV